MITIVLIRRHVSLAMLIAGLAVLAFLPSRAEAQGRFQIEEVTIADMHNAIKSGQTTCKAIVQAYIDRRRRTTARARRSSHWTGHRFLQRRVRCAPVHHSGFQPPLYRCRASFRMFRSTQGCLSSSAGWSRRFRPGCAAAVRHARRHSERGQLNALETLNIRGERSVTCKGDFDRAPSAGPLPPGAPAVCEEFRKQPDALERAAELDQQYGTKPDLEKLPMYMRGALLEELVRRQGHARDRCNDVNFAMDVPKVDSPDIAELRVKARSFTPLPRRQRRRCIGVRAGEGEDLDALRQSQVRAVGRSGLQPVRHHARSARHEQRLRRLGRGEPGRVFDLRAGLRVLQGTSLEEQRGQPPDHEGNPDGRRYYE